MNTLAQLLISGVLSGAVYTLVALGLSLVFGIMRVINLSHGSFYALGSFLTYWFAVDLGLHQFLALPAVFLLSFLLGILVERLCVGPVRKHPVTVAIITLGVAIFIEQLLHLIWGPFYLSVPRALPAVAAGGLAWDLQQVAAGGIAVLIIGIFFLLLRTKVGVAVRMVAQDAEGAELVGINVEAVQMVVFGMAGALAAVSGSLTCALHSVYPAMGRAPMVLSLAMVIVGGLGSIQGALVAGLSMGVLNAVVGFYLRPEWTYIFALMAIVAVLLYRPSGLFGKVILRD
ncbi:MAG: branched-chain amino acid ABC transporter permease [Peptococcaceae bacterium]|nr:branched-chain amino acid ABC transporter permease [Peptococcaceae bacterium]